MVVLEESHSCVYQNSSQHNSNCHRDNKESCDIRRCKKDVKACVSVYSNKTGQLKPLYMNCLHSNRDYTSGSTCGTDSCVLEFYNGHYTCCCYSSLCNINISLPHVNAVKTTAFMKRAGSEGGDKNDGILLASILAPLFLVVLICILVIQRQRKRVVQRENHYLLEPLEAQSLPSIDKSIELLETVHQGQFSNVSKANFGNELVAVKNIIVSQSELWENEKDIYEKCELSHQNVLRFIAAEKMNDVAEIRHWIVTEYCSKGSLGEYLQINTLCFSQLMNMTIGILKGLDYLHFSNNSCSVTVAHRDIKTSNILVKSDLTCCIADFGLSLAFPFGEVQKSMDMSQVGTRRYMAPEVLRGAMTFSPECFIAVDMYAFALVAWELLSRTNGEEIVADAYELPYTSDVGQHPSLESMIQCVVEQKKRPLIKDKWRSNSTLQVLCETIEECWDMDAYARISAKLAYIRLSRLPVLSPCERCASINVSSNDWRSEIDETSNNSGEVVILDKTI